MASAADAEGKDDDDDDDDDKEEEEDEDDNVADDSSLAAIAEVTEFCSRFGRPFRRRALASSTNFSTTSVSSR